MADFAISGASQAASLALETKTPVVKKESVEQAKTTSPLDKGDSAKISETSKGAVWEGVKFGAKQGFKEGVIGGAIAGPAAVILLTGAMSAIGTGKFKPIMDPKLLLGSVALGAAVGAYQGTIERAVDGGASAALIKASEKQAAKKGTDSDSQISKNAKIAGAVLGAGGGLYQGISTAKGMSNPYAKVAVIAGMTGLAAWSGSVAAERFVGKVNNGIK
jgi:hypothetical protein